MNRDTRLILYACPTGPLHQELETYFMYVEQQFGPNGAHKYPPHVTLTSFFSVPDKRQVGAIAAELRTAFRGKPAPSFFMRDVVLRGTRSPGRTVKIAMVCPWIEAPMLEFRAKVAHMVHSQVSVKPSQSHHLSLAYSYRVSDHDTIVSSVRDRISAFRHSNTPAENSVAMWSSAYWDVCLCEPPSEEILDVPKNQSLPWSTICANWIEHARLTFGGSI